MISPRAFLVVGLFFLAQQCWAEEGSIWSEVSIEENNAYGSESNFVSRIIGGRPIQISEAPWHAAIVYNHSFVCSGAVFGRDRRFVLTTANCVHGRSAQNFTVVAGTSSFKSGGETRSVRRVISHRRFDSTTYGYDIAVLELAANFDNQNVSSARLAQSKDYLPASGIITGWGAVTADNPNPARNLQALELPITTGKWCNSAYPPTQFCGIRDADQGSCNRDGGDPLASHRVVYGFVTYGNCGGRTVLTSVPALRKWIDDVVDIVISN